MLGGVATEDWRVRIELEAPDELGRFLERVRHGLGLEARELADALEEEHLAVSRDGNELFVYSSTRAKARQARRVVEAELREHDLIATVSRVEHWLDDDQRWDNEPEGETWEEELESHGYAPWEVHVTCRSRGEAEQLTERLEADGYRPVRRWQFVIVGTDTREDAKRLAERLDGEVEVGGALVWSEALDSGVMRPFTIF